ncbi:hypothetical protein ACS0TY_015735 [Phlomoides rotata]
MGEPVEIVSSSGIHTQEINKGKHAEIVSNSSSSSSSHIHTQGSNMGEPKIVPSSGMREWIVNIENERNRKGPLPKAEHLDDSMKRRCIFKLPATVLVQPDDDDVYRPYMISLGPYHHGEEKCKAREKDKEASLIHFLRRSDAPLQEYVDIIGEEVNKLRDAYDQLDHRWRLETDSFIWMMLLDGCFVLELLRSSIDNPVISCILENPGEIKCYQHDMLLLENQLPIMLLESLCVVQKYERALPTTIIVRDISAMFMSRTNLSVGKYMDDRFDRSMHIVTRISSKFKENNLQFLHSLHVLDVYRMLLLRHDTRGKSHQERGRLIILNIPSATELHNVKIGITTSMSTSLVDINFRRNTLFLPPIVVDASTKSLFLNLVALEQVNKFPRKEVTAYMFLMGGLVQSGADASLLQSRGVIITALPAAELAKLFNRMTRDISLDPDFSPSFIEMVEMLRARYNKMSNEWRKDLFQTYLKSPWAIISVVAALLLFTLTTIQTVYTVLSYVHPK